jgi:hypothetical protein
MHQHTDTTEDIDIVAIWLRRDPARWIAGAMAGFFAGLVMLAFATVLSALFGPEPWFPVKIPAVVFYGGYATEYGIHISRMLAGFLLHESLCVVLGVIYAHFTGTNNMPALLGAGFTWGAFSWIFIQCLFAPAIRQIYAMNLPRGPAFFVCMVFGLSLASVAFFDRMVRR